MTILILAQRGAGARKIGEDIADIIRGEPWPWPQLLIGLALVVIGTLAYGFWKARRENTRNP